MTVPRGLAAPSRVQISYVDKGETVNDYASELSATVYRRGARYEVQIVDKWGTTRDRGVVKWKGSRNRRYRAASLDELLRIAISEERTRPTDENKRDDAVALIDAVREAIYDAQDIEEERLAKAQ